MSSPSGHIMRMCVCVCSGPSAACPRLSSFVTSGCSMHRVSRCTERHALVVVVMVVRLCDTSFRSYSPGPDNYIWRLVGRALIRVTRSSRGFPGHWVGGARRPSQYAWRFRLTVVARRGEGSLGHTRGPLRACPSGSQGKCIAPSAAGRTPGAALEFSARR